MTLSAPASPMRLLDELLSTSIPFAMFSNPAVPLAFVLMKLPSIVVLFAPERSIPWLPLPLMTFRAAAAVPPTTLPEEESRTPSCCSRCGKSRPG